MTTTLPLVFLIAWHGIALAQDSEDALHSRVLETIKTERTSRIVSVMDKTSVAPSGDKHDYFALSPYHWPNPKTIDGLPYVFKDGQVNPDANTDRYDRVAYFRMGDAITRLALGYHLTGEKEYATRAAAWIRTWFIDPSTRMNPNLEYSQCIPGRQSGEAIGLIRGMTIIDVVRAERLIAKSEALSADDQQSFHAWIKAFRDWLVSSELGQLERRAINNHGTWYAAQVAVLSVWLGDDEQAAGIIREVKEQRITRQITPTGLQPMEMLRTKSWDYSVMNIEGLVVLADVGKHVGEDIWSYEDSAGRGLRKAIDYLVPYALGERAWPGKQIRDWEPQRLRPILVRADRAIPDAGYAAILPMIPADDVNSFIRSQLLAVDLRQE